jgi:serine/threonine protein kinase
MINLCGEFNGQFQSGKYYKKFFQNNKLINMEYNDDFKMSTFDKINKKIINTQNVNIIRLIESMLQINPKKRPSVKDLLKNNWMD